MIAEDIALSQRLFGRVKHYPELEPLTQSLSIATFRYVPLDLKAAQAAAYLDELNRELLTRLQNSGEAYFEIVDFMMGSWYETREGPTAPAYPPMAEPASRDKWDNTLPTVPSPSRAAPICL